MLHAIWSLLYGHFYDSTSENLALIENLEKKEVIFYSPNSTDNCYDT